MTERPNSGLTIMNHPHRSTRFNDICLFGVFLLVFCSRMVFLDRIQWQSEGGSRLLQAVANTQITVNHSGIQPGLGGLFTTAQEGVYTVGIAVFGTDPLSPFLAEGVLLALLSVGGYAVLRKFVASPLLACAVVLSCAWLPEWSLSMRGGVPSVPGAGSLLLLGIVVVSVLAVRLQVRLQPVFLGLAFFVMAVNGWRSIVAVHHLPSVAPALQTVAWIERTRANKPVVLVSYDSSTEFLNYLNALLMLRNVPLSEQGVRYVVTMENDAVLPVQNSVITAFDSIRIARRTGYER